MAAVLVEAAKFFYAYGFVSTSEEHGVQQVVDMELQDGEKVLGARLLPAPEAAKEGSRQRVQLVIVTSAGRMLLYSLVA